MARGQGHVSNPLYGIRRALPADQARISNNAVREILHRWDKLVGFDEPHLDIAAGRQAYTIAEHFVRIPDTLPARVQTIGLREKTLVKKVSDLVNSCSEQQFDCSYKDLPSKEARRQVLQIAIKQA